MTEDEEYELPTVEEHDGRVAMRFRFEEYSLTTREARELGERLIEQVSEMKDDE